MKSKKSKKSKRDKNPIGRRAGNIRRIFTKPAYLIFLIIAIIVYYWAFSYIIANSNYGLFLVTVPAYAIYLLVFTSAVLASISVYTIASRIKHGNGISYGISGSATLLAGGTIASCACQIPVFVSFLYLVGATAVDVTFVTFYINSLQIYLMAALIAANLVLIYHYLGKMR